MLTVIALTGVVLWQSDVGREHMLGLVQRTDPVLLTAALAVMTCGMMFTALRWRALIPGGEGLPVLGLTGVECVGLLFNYVLPGPMGELAMAGLVKVRYGIGLAPALAAGVHARFLGLATAGALAGASYLLGDLPVPNEYEGLVAFTATAIAVGAVGLGLLSTRPRILRGLSQQSFGRLADATSGRVSRWSRRLDDMVAHVASALGDVGALGWRRYGEATMWAVVGHITVASGIALGATAMGLSPNPAGVMFTYCAATAGVVALFALPGAQVGWDAMFCGLFMVTTGVDLADALSVTAMVRGQQLILLLLGAGAGGILGVRSLSAGATRAPAARRPTATPPETPRAAPPPSAP